MALFALWCVFLLKLTNQNGLYTKPFLYTPSPARDKPECSVYDGASLILKKNECTYAHVTQSNMIKISIMIH